MATAAKKVLADGGLLDVVHWKDAFPDATTVIEGLLKALDHFDFGFFLLTDDDLLTMRGERTDAPRDNVVFELGLFTGRLGSKRTFIVVPNEPKVHLPSDLLGVLVGTYDSMDNRPTMQQLTSAVRGAATEARMKMLELGPKPLPENTAPAVAAIRTSSIPVGATADPWTAAAEAGALHQLATNHVRIGTAVVDDLRGVGRIIEVGPETDEPNRRFVVVEFSDGSNTRFRAQELKELRFIHHL
jgi:hypothetical protein